jgi:hypothetical protein
MAPSVRNREHLHSIDVIRDRIRRECAPSGLVVEDLDMVIRVFGPRNRTDATGRLALFEFKHGPCSNLTEGQENTFGMLHDMLEPHERYAGFWRVNFECVGDTAIFLRARRMWKRPAEMLIGDAAVIGFIGTLDPIHVTREDAA